MTSGARPLGEGGAVVSTRRLFTTREGWIATARRGTKGMGDLSRRQESFEAD
jgi:hypothetical protein